MKRIIAHVPVFGLKKEKALQEGKKHKDYIKKQFPKYNVAVLYSTDEGSEDLSILKNEKVYDNVEQEIVWKLVLPTVNMGEKKKKAYIKERTETLRKELNMKKKEKIFVVESTNRGEIDLMFYND